MKRGVLAGTVAAAVAGLLLGCSGNADPVDESASITHDEAVIAKYAETHGNGSGVGAPAGCTDRVIGKVDKGQTRVAYIELMCSELSRRRHCASMDQTAFVSAAVATMASGGPVTALAVDEEDDAAYAHWVEGHFPGKWQHVEVDGPHYGKLLQARLQAKYPCHEVT